MSSRLLTRRNGWLACIVFVGFLLLAAHRNRRVRDHYLDSKVLSSGDWQTNCREHGFSMFHGPRKVYDLVLFSTELDWLEIRLHTHSPFVDYFVIVESPTTFTKKPKPLHLKENWTRFQDFHHKIIYRVVEDPIDSNRHWDHEDFFRNSMLRVVFPNLSGQEAAQNKDVLIVSDMDELIKPGALLLMRHCDIPKRLTLRSYFYYYSFQWLHRGEEWPHPQATTFGASVEDTIAPNDLRMNLMSPGLLPFAALSRWWESATLWDAGWHCSSCFSTIAEMQTKMNSFSHQSWNTEDNRNEATIVQRVRGGLDLFARPGEIYDKVEGNKDVPLYVLSEYQRAGRFEYLVERGGENAGFEDYNVDKK